MLGPILIFLLQRSKDILVYFKINIELKPATQMIPGRAIDSSDNLLPSNTIKDVFFS